MDADSGEAAGSGEVAGRGEVTSPLPCLSCSRVSSSSAMPSIPARLRNIAVSQVEAGRRVALQDGGDDVVGGHAVGDAVVAHDEAMAHDVERQVGHVEG